MNRSSKGSTLRSRILGVALLALGILILVSLFSYTPQATDAGTPPENPGGWLGAQMSHYLMLAVGYGAYGLGLIVLLWGWTRLWLFPVRAMVLRTLALLALTVIYCGASSLLAEGDVALSLEPGGWLGVTLSTQILLPFVGKFGSLLLLLALLLCVLAIVKETRGLFLFILRPIRALIGSRRKASGTPDAPPIAEAEPETEAPEDTEPEEVEPEQEEERAHTSLFQKPPSKPYVTPGPDLLQLPTKGEGAPDDEALRGMAANLETVLGNFGAGGKVVQVDPGPVITTYEVEPPTGMKVSKIAGLSDDLALALKAQTIRIQAPIPGKGVVGIEVPNDQPETVYLRELLESSDFRESDARLMLALGKTATGGCYSSDLAKMPHLLIAGATGSGKSICIHALIASLLFRNGPEDVRLIMVDPKMLELSIYNSIPHLVTPVVTDPTKAAQVLGWAVSEMESRYQTMSGHNVRNILEFNEELGKRREQADSDAKRDEVPVNLPYLVVVIDELADLMMTAPAEIEGSLARLAQMGRAVGIHLIVATQRPSVNVITGTIKANFPSRIAFRVASMVDSRTVIDTNGAEQLLGNGDMLYLPAGVSAPLRLHGAFTSTDETKQLVSKVDSQGISVDRLEVDIAVRISAGNN